MATFHIIDYRTISGNTAADRTPRPIRCSCACSCYGYGDFPEHILYVTLTVEADTVRKAQNKAKKIDPTLSFGGQFGNRVLTDAELVRQTWVDRPPWGNDPYKLASGPFMPLWGNDPL
jgi:hypothetical protein